MKERIREKNHLLNSFPPPPRYSIDALDQAGAKVVRHSTRRPLPTTFGSPEGPSTRVLELLFFSSGDPDPAALLSIYRGAACVRRD